MGGGSSGETRVGVCQKGTGHEWGAMSGWESRVRWCHEWAGVTSVKSRVGAGHEWVRVTSEWRQEWVKSRMGEFTSG